MKKLFAVFLFSSLSISSVFACGGQSFDVLGNGNVLLNADGLTTLVTDAEGVVLTQSQADAKPGFSASARISGFETSEFAIRLVGQSRDSGGIMSSTYEVTETNRSVSPVKIEMNRYKISSNYIGNGMRTRGGCGSIVNESDSQIIR